MTIKVVSKYMLCILVIVGLVLSSTIIPAQHNKATNTRIIVAYKSDQVKSNVMNILDQNQGKFIKEIEQGNLLVYSIPSMKRKLLEQTLSTYIDYIEEDSYSYQACFTPNDYYWPQWNMQMIDVDYTWDLVQGDHSVIVALLDTGIDYNHNDLDANVDESIGWDYVNNDPDPMDDNDHGTLTGGIICAEINNGIGIAGMAQITLMPMKVLDQSGSGWTSDIVDAIYDAGDGGANVISMSFGSYWYSGSLSSACNWAYNTKGIVLCGAAGNDDTSSKHYPAAYDTVIGVGAVTSSRQRWYYSNYGDNVEIMAPGVWVITTDRGNSYAYATGTSLSCPHVAGAAALAFSARATMTNTQFRNIMRNWADDMGQPGYDQQTGYGLLDCWGQID